MHGAKPVEARREDMDIEGRDGLWAAPVGHDHALFSAEDELFATEAGDAAIEGLGVCEGDVGTDG